MIAIATMMPIRLMEAATRVVGFSKLLVVPSGAGLAGTWQRSIDMMEGGDVSTVSNKDDRTWYGTSVLVQYKDK